MDLKKTLAAATLTIGLAIVPAFAQGGLGKGRAGGGFGSGRMLERMSVVLELTDAQKEFAKKLAADTRAQAHPLAQQLRTVRQELAAAVKANNQSQIETLTAQRGTLMGQLGALHAKARASFYAQLTEEQKAKADQLRGTMMKRGNGMRERANNRG